LLSLFNTVITYLKLYDRKIWLTLAAWMAGWLAGWGDGEGARQRLKTNSTF
jgi:hypothetical protein